MGDYSEPFTCTYTPASGPDHVFDGFLQPLAPLVEAMAIKGHWTLADDGGVVSNNPQQSDQTRAFELLTEPVLRFTFNIRSPGPYSLNITARRPSAATPTNTSSDVWIGVTGAIDTTSANYPTAIAGVNWGDTAIKGFLSGVRSDTYVYRIFYNDADAHSMILPLFAGPVEISIAGRSPGMHLFDCILYQDNKFKKFQLEDKSLRVKFHFDNPSEPEPEPEPVDVEMEEEPGALPPVVAIPSDYTDRFICEYITANGNTQVFDGFLQPLRPLVEALNDPGHWALDVGVPEEEGGIEYDAGGIISNVAQQEGDFRWISSLLPPVLKFTFNIATAGIYHLSVSARRPGPDTPNNTASDVWIGIRGAIDTNSPHYTSAIAGLNWGDAAFNCFLSGTRFDDYSYQLYYSGGNVHSPMVPLVPGVVEISIAGRSPGIYLRDCILYEENIFKRFHWEDKAQTIPLFFANPLPLPDDLVIHPLPLPGVQAPVLIAAKEPNSKVTVLTAAVPLSDGEFVGVGYQVEMHGMQFNVARPADPYGYFYTKHYDEVLGKVMRETRPSFVRDKQIDIMTIANDNIANVDSPVFTDPSIIEFFAMMRHFIWADSDLFLASGMKFLRGEFGQRKPGTSFGESGPLYDEVKQTNFAKLFVAFLEEFKDRGHKVTFITPSNEMTTGEEKYVETPQARLAYKQLIQKIQAELEVEGRGLAGVKQVIFDQNNAFVDTPNNITNALQWMLEAIEDPDYEELTHAYGVHSYPLDMRHSRRGFLATDLDSYQAVLDRFKVLVDATKKSDRPAPFVVGEFGSGKARYPAETVMNDRYIGEVFGIYIAECTIAMMLAGVDGMCYWTFNDLMYGAALKHGLLAGVTEGYRAYPVYYIYGQMSRWCRGPNATVFQTTSTDPLVRAVGMRTEDAEYRFILVNRNKQEKVITLTTDGHETTFRARVYVYQVGHIPYTHENIFNDLPKHDYTLGFIDGTSQVTLPLQSVVLVVQDTHFFTPNRPKKPKVRAIGNGIQVYDIARNYITTDTAYFRIYRGRSQQTTQYDEAEENYAGCIAGDVDSFVDINVPPTLDLANEWLCYRVQAVDKYGNESPLSEATNLIRSATEPFFINPTFFSTPGGQPAGWVVQRGAFSRVPGSNRFEDMQYVRNTAPNSVLYQTVNLGPQTTARVTCDVICTTEWTTGTPPPFIWASRQVGNEWQPIATQRVSYSPYNNTYKLIFTTPESDTTMDIRIGMTVNSGVIQFSKWDIKRLLLTNPDFVELDDKLPVGWTLSPSNAFFMASTTETPNPGFRAFAHKQSNSQRLIEQTVTLPKNTIYEVSVWAQRIQNYNSKLNARIWAQVMVGDQWVEVGSAWLGNVAGPRRYSFEFETLQDNSTDGTYDVKIGYSNANSGGYALARWRLDRVDPGHRYDPHTVNRNHLLHGDFKEAAWPSRTVYEPSVNGKSFTYPSEYSQQPWVWTADNDHTQPPFSYSDEDWYTPLRSLKLAATSSGVICRQVVEYIRTKIRYRLTFWAKASQVQKPVFVGIQNMAGVWITRKEISESSVWTKHTIYFESNTHFVQVAIEDNGKGTFFFDHFDLRRDKAHASGPL